jgi:hypothetical protein
MAVVVLLGIWLVYELIHDPYEKKKAATPNPPGSGDVARAEPPAGLDYKTIQQVISGNQRLWMPLVQKPKRPPPPPDLTKMTDGLQVIAILSENDELKCIIKDKNAHTVYKKGDRVRELTVDAVTPSHIVLSYKGHTIKLSL